MCTKDKQQIFGNIVGEGFHALPHVRLSKIGKEVDNTIKYIGKYDFINMDKYVIMPNHVHIIISFEYPAGGCGNPPLQAENPTYPPLQEIIKRLKTYTNKQYNKLSNRNDLKLWQRSFHDHIIRNENDYKTIWEYIENNPFKWEHDRYYRKDTT